MALFSRFPKIGVLLLGIWLILYGVFHFVLVFQGSGTILAVLAIVAGIVLILDR